MPVSKVILKKRGLKEGNTYYVVAANQLSVFDIHKKVCAVCMKDEKGRILQEFQIRNTKEGIGELLALLKGKDASVVMESTSTFWIHVISQVPYSTILRFF